MPFIHCFSFLILWAMTSFSAALPLDDIQLPPGFHIQVYAKVPNARSMTLGSNGVVFVGSRSAGNVYAVLPAADYAKAKKVIVIASKLNSPNGVAFYRGDLYVAEISRVLRYNDIQQHLNQPPQPVVITNKLPTNAHHGWRYIAFGPQGWLYIAIGAPCNICKRQDPRFATIARMRADGSDFQIYAKGVRNSVGFDWDPATGYFWFSDNGRDWLGNDIPPDEINVAPRQGLNFGYPYYYGNRIPDPKFSKRPPASRITPATFEIQAHSAPLGIRFYRGKQFPSRFDGSLFVAEHGSWNRLTKVGYQIINLEVKGKQVVSHSVFAKGWLQGQSAWGRPVDVLELPDGSLLVSDDKAGVIYRITYRA